MKANREKEDIVMRAVLADKLIILSDGKIYRANGARAERNPGNGYLQVRFMENKVRGYACSHRIVYRRFHGDIPPGLTINHKNGVKNDNRPENLELATYSGQVKHAKLVLGRRYKIQDGESNDMAKLTAGAIREIRRRRAAGESLKSIGKAFGTTDRNISKIALGHRWQSIK